MASKQTGRYLRYKLAFERLDEALEEGWLLEAISLEESIISDRLLSALQTLVGETSARQSLNNLINQAKKAFAEKGGDTEDDLFDQLHQWRQDRNECVHAFCRLDDHAYSDSSAEIFGEKMWETAKKGRELVDLVKHLSKIAKNISN
ncbi:hypothetical protein KBZ20_16660 [Vulcanococcus limneticus Candia 3F8]|uniref:hypothetical protein n=1 Tax=Vulcanococcus limneticus TaxID=2170428 RepID=UPI0012FF7175|nr:hypothetical protein [Vulcanococcus limneticus]MCP9793369.1 hypothetical protein [Vulcanococcus limneticus MW73D5]MCP9895397.1 hypothetical protein [Vulcanococcus limneticus Candia 3F8]MCP9898744.1 hypothetical protein [Vulcanococcus limneticus Candia 3B3]